MSGAKTDSGQEQHDVAASSRSVPFAEPTLAELPIGGLGAFG